MLVSAPLGRATNEARRARFARWEQLGLDQVKHDLENGGHRLVGGPPSVRRLAWDWVRLKEAEQAAQALGAVPTSLENALGIRSCLDDALTELLQPKPTSQPSAQQVTTPTAVEGGAELVSLKVNVSRGITVDLKEGGRRVSSWWQKWRGPLS